MTPGLWRKALSPSVKILSPTKSNSWPITGSEKRLSTWSQDIKWWFDFSFSRWAGYCKIHWLIILGNNPWMEMLCLEFGPVRSIGPKLIILKIQRRHGSWYLSDIWVTDMISVTVGLVLLPEFAPMASWKFLNASWWRMKTLKPDSWIGHFSTLLDIKNMDCSCIAALALGDPIGQCWEDTFPWGEI